MFSSLFSPRSKKPVKSADSFLVFEPANAKGGADIVASKTAMVCIEFQNEFATEGGKCYEALKPVMETTGMLAKAAATADALRAAGGTVIFVPIIFKADASDNPNKGIGILQGCAKDSLFTEGTWNADFCKEMSPKEGDPIVTGKRGLDAFPNTNLEELLVSKGIETVALCGFLTNCCVESTMRTACEKGYNVVTLTDCCACTSAEGQKAATEGTFGMFSQPMVAEDFKKKLSFNSLWSKYDEKMAAEGCNPVAIAAFKYTFEKLTSGVSLNIGEKDIQPVDSLPTYDSLTDEKPDLFAKTVMLKLNGGLGTGMGLDKAKSLLELKDGLSFLDFIAKQVDSVRESTGKPLAFMLMNSFSTSDDTLKHLEKYPTLKSDGLPLEFVQNKAPKVAADGYEPASWEANPSMEWCPPGHGDLYPAMVGSGALDMLLEKGFEYMFVSNSDNLGATMDLKLLTWFADSGKPFAMECAARTAADKKGGHLALKGEQMLLREAAQCPDEDEAEFQNTDKYKFFNTNNLWLNLKELKAALDKAKDGVLPLPVIKNGKTVDPVKDGKDGREKSPKVLQLETAMGSAIECFPGAGAILIPRTRFAPVKTTNDMLALMSDAYEVTKDFRMVLSASCRGVPPDIKLDGKYKFVPALMTLVPNGPPSLIGCKKLSIVGMVSFAAGVVFKGTVKVTNAGEETKELAAGTYEDTEVTL
uniref:UTP--glucose-1-phosphate uridylyltransferase n=1 Tax=Haptolina brevifila TaxID=156173 RepID=A0A7S2NMR5_9EUKA|mmetsp:Transcript_82896/g.165471  ORF Transcript_82896/g.165471 Transcript_82896/m.165471 type:complete len:701 (+) Transcript_82896:38-2140(+)